MSCVQQMMCRYDARGRCGGRARGCSCRPPEHLADMQGGVGYEVVRETGKVVRGGEGDTGEILRGRGGRRVRGSDSYSWFKVQNV